MSQQGLRSFLRETSAISERLSQLKKLSTNNITDSNDDTYVVETEILTERARQLVSTLNLDMLGAVLPDRRDLESMTAPIYYIDIYESEYIHVLRGALSINSYTKLSHDEQEALKEIKSDALSPSVTIAKFEGISNRWHSDDCVYLGPKFSNIHSLTPLEDGAAFFDLLMPGYRDKPCTYFKNIVQNPKLKQACLLQKLTIISFHFEIWKNEFFASM
ncbi:hypothetical protein DINM_005951 [Dirofilaria immitis]|nr:hypothetical protein [Dirofilaria immitis]